MQRDNSQRAASSSESRLSPLTSLKSTAIVASGVDAAMAAFAAGVTRAGQHVAMIGASMCWGYINQSVDARHRLIRMSHVFNGQRDIYIFGGASPAGAAVAWYREQFRHAQIEAARALPHGDPHRLLEDAAAKIPAGADGTQ